MIKAVVSVFRKPGLSWEAFVPRWRDQHGALVRRHAGAMRYKKYVQSHFEPSPDIEVFAALRGWASPPEGLAETWWESMEEMRAALATPEGQAASRELARDEAEFVDMSRISVFLSREHIVFDLTYT